MTLGPVGEPGGLRRRIARLRLESFAGQDIDVAVFYPEDDDYLIDRETTVMHYEVARTL